MSENVILTEEQQQALRELIRGKNVFLTGKAGTGKSTVLMAFRKQTARSVVFLAPTGMAARQINGETCHRFFSLKPLAVLSPELLEPLDDQKRKVLQRVETIVIDEVSMLRSDCLAAIDKRLRDAAGINSPFGGKQMVFCGDFCQLLPVVKPLPDFDLPAWLARQFGGCLAFQTQLWQNAKIRTIVLHQVMRQKDNWLLNRLNDIRYGIPSESEKWLCEANRVFCKEVPEGESIIELCTRNADAERLNRQALKKLSGEVIHSRAVISGDFPWQSYPTDKDLKLKAGLRVMLLRNQNRTEDPYVNGDLGVILRIDTLSQDQPRVTVRLDRGPVITVEGMEWEHWGYSVAHDDDGRERLTLKKDGSFTQLPLKAAYAISIHKSQGMTFNQLKLRLGSGCFASGQLYTALSRCRTAAGIFLVTPITAGDTICIPEVIEAYRGWDFSLKLWWEILTRHLDRLPDELVGTPSVIDLGWQEASEIPVLACLQQAYREFCCRCPQESDGEAAICSTPETVWALSIYYELTKLQRTQLWHAALCWLINKVRLIKYRTQFCAA